jgi:hypothetical protein
VVETVLHSRAMRALVSLLFLVIVALAYLLNHQRALIKAHERPSGS